MLLRTLLCISGAVTFVAACNPNESGRVRATQFGSRSDVPAPRARYDQLMHDACGDAAQESVTGVLRTPYLQRVSADSAEILWTSSSSKSYTLELARSNGRPAGSFRSRIEGTQMLREGAQQVVDLSDLAPDTLYCYGLRAPDAPLSPQGGLRTAPGPGTGKPVSFVAFGDGGDGGADQRSVFKQVQTVPFDLVLITGDVAYPAGSLDSYERNFFAVYAAMLSSFPVFPVLGNHDYRTASAAPYREVFALPENGGPAGLERWYSFDWGDVHFVGLDSERIGKAQADWLHADLGGQHAAVDGRNSAQGPLLIRGAWLEPRVPQRVLADPRIPSRATGADRPRP